MPSQAGGRIELAALNNALWCDAVCRSQGLSPTCTGTAWASATRTPTYYPDAVSLSETADARDILGLIDTTPGASVKDSWARLDLTPAGFAPVIPGQWVWRSADDPQHTSRAGDGRTWREVLTAAEMEQWSRAWAGDANDSTILLPALVDEPSVHVLVALDGDGAFSAGCIVNTSGTTAGLTNHFAVDDDAHRAWRGAARAAAALLPGHDLVAWESGDGVDAARNSGFEVIGPLTVWIA